MNAKAVSAVPALAVTPGKDLLAALLQTTNDVLPTILRVTSAVVVLPHGLQKAFGWFGGWGFSGTLRFFTDVLQLPVPVAMFATASDLLGALALLAGVFTRVAALGTLITMLGAIAIVHLQNGFFMNWGGTNAGEGYELHILVIGMMLALVRSGGGRASVDAILARKLGASAE